MSWQRCRHVRGDIESPRGLFEGQKKELSGDPAGDRSQRVSIRRPTLTPSQLGPIDRGILVQRCPDSVSRWRKAGGFPQASGSGNGSPDLPRIRPAPAPRDHHHLPDPRPVKAIAHLEGVDLPSPGQGRRIAAETATRCLADD